MMAGSDRAAMRGARLLSDHLSEQQRDPVGFGTLALPFGIDDAAYPCCGFTNPAPWHVRSGAIVDENLRKPYDGFHTSGIAKMPARRIFRSCRRAASVHICR